MTSRHLLWLRHWQADMKSKWKLASAPFKGGKLFGEALDPVLVECKDKRKILPTFNKKQERKTLPYFRRQSFRANESSFNNTTFHRPFNQSSEWTQDRQSFRDGAGSNTPIADQIEEGPPTSPFARASDHKGLLPNRGRLQLFVSQWEETTEDSWVLHTVRLGLALEF